MIDLISWLGILFPALLVVFIIYSFAIQRRAASGSKAAIQQLEESKALSLRNNAIFEEMLVLQRENREVLRQMLDRLGK